MANEIDSWPAGATWVFQGTVTEDATAGTHVSSLTVSPGEGGELQILYARFLAGAGAANLTGFVIDDGANILLNLLGTGVAGAGGQVSLASGNELNWPNGSNTGFAAANQVSTIPATGTIVSGPMRFIMRTSTATVSLVHTFAVVCRIKGAVPTATLADTVGTPTLTTNTSRVM
jgi:hypothetical protein